MKAPEGMLRMSVPAAALAGDTLLFTKGLRHEWTCQIQRQHFDLRAPPPVSPKEDMQRHVELHQALQANSGYWSNKIERASLDKLEVSGVVAIAPIVEGEVLVKCPSASHISPGFVRRLKPELATLAAVVGREAPADNQDIDVFLVSMFVADLLTKCMQDGAATSLGAHGDILCSFARVLLCETFEKHPYRLAASSASAASFRRGLNPSCEADLIERLSWGVIERYRLLCAEHPVAFSAEQFLRAWLMVITRAFELGGSRSTLVPGLDSFNHDPVKRCAAVRLDSSGDMWLEATRCIEPGEEVYLEYGELSNPLLYRTYGFTLPPEARSLQQTVRCCAAPLALGSSRVVARCCPFTAAWSYRIESSEFLEAARGFGWVGLVCEEICRAWLQARTSGSH